MAGIAESNLANRVHRVATGVSSHGSHSWQSSAGLAPPPLTTGSPAAPQPLFHPMPLSIHPLSLGLHTNTCLRRTLKR